MAGGGARAWESIAWLFPTGACHCMSCFHLLSASVADFGQASSVLAQFYSPPVIVTSEYLGDWVRGSAAVWLQGAVIALCAVPPVYRSSSSTA